MTNAPIVAICTFQRPAVVDAINSVIAQTLCPGKLIVIDNDDHPTGQSRVQRLSDSAPFPIEYAHVPGRNIAIARNAALTAAAGRRLAFLDDDEVADPRWLASLSGSLNEGPWSAVFGPVKPVYAPDAPAWMKKAAPHGQTVWTRRGIIESGYTGNCLIDLDHPAFEGLRFDPAFGRRHGADADFFLAAYKRGARYASAPSAMVHEPVPTERVRFAWLAERRMEMGIAAVRTLPESGLPLALKASAKAAACFAMAALQAPWTDKRAMATLRGLLHVGVVKGALGHDATDVYGGTQATVPPSAPKASGAP